MNKQLSYQGKQISYRITGTGKPVVLVHGFGEDATVWRKQVGPPPNYVTNLRKTQLPPKEGLQTPLFENSLLNGNFKFIIPDLPGTGGSEMIDDMSMEGMAEVIKRIVDVEAPPNPSAGNPLPPEEEAAPNPSEGGALRVSLCFENTFINDPKSPFGGFRGL